MNKPSPRFELLDHTADMLVRAHGATLGEMFASAAAALFHAISPSKVAEVGEYGVRLSAETPEDLLVKFLSELLYLYETEKLLLGRFDVVVAEGETCTVEARVAGERADPQRHEYGTEVKAITYHGLKIDRERGFLEVVFDL